MTTGLFGNVFWSSGMLYRIEIQFWRSLTQLVETLMKLRNQKSIENEKRVTGGNLGTPSFERTVVIVGSPLNCYARN